ncbi:oxidoreductase [Lithospermum erythrorhizon]|uniref:Oxidoreductase n=1 Tax=Lithospermum erythrorhizon TaxID=34254 RepID=A0AAV3RBH0_LITER
MGCGTSKPKVCQNCQAPFSPMQQRSKSMHVHHLPKRETDIIHRVSFTSTTLGSLSLDPLFTNSYIKEELAQEEDFFFEEDLENKCKEDFSMGMIEAKIWSEMIEEKINKVVPKTPSQTPPGEPETIINTWELMEGLEDTSPLRPHHFRSFSFYVQPNHVHSFYDQPTPKVQENDYQEVKRMWLENAENDHESIISEFDPEVISSFRKALEDLPQVDPFRLDPSSNETGDAMMRMDSELEDSDVKKVNGSVVEEYEPEALRVKEKLVLYFTSLRGVRKTYDDCCHVRMILKGLGVKIDERDVSMHSGFKEELKELLGELYPGGSLPKVFIGTKYIGGAAEIRRMHELGQLEKLMETCEIMESTKGGSGGDAGSCEACGDVRFVPCDTCSGSCKIYNEGDFDEGIEEDEYGFQRCPNCNENGLIRCPVCCD